jgi:hypothetical protein
VQDRGPGSKGLTEDVDELVEPQGLRAGGVDDLIAAGLRCLLADTREVIDVHWLNVVAAVAWEHEDRDVSEDPRDVVGQHVAVATEDPGRPDDRVWNPDLSQRPFD